MIKRNREPRFIGRATNGVLLIFGLLAISGTATAQKPKIVVSDPVTPTISRPVSELPEARPADGEIRDINPRQTHEEDERKRKAKEPTFGPEQKSDFDPLALLQSSFRPAAPGAFSTPILSFNGQGFTNVNPPDTTGDIGPNHYVQSINAASGALVRIYNKTTGATIGNQFAMETLGTTQCASGAGDPIVLYDQAADRWLLSEFSSAGNRLCVYISTSPDPAGTYFAYNFSAPGFPDYPKYGVWPNAYYVSTNESLPAVYALNRPNMLLGQAATFIRFTAPKLSGFGFQALTPADVDGSVGPAAAAPGIFMRQVDDEIHFPPGTAGSDELQIWTFSPNFVTPANSTFTQQTSIRGTESFRVDRRPDVAGRNRPTDDVLHSPSLFTEFNSTLCGQTSFSCMGMPGVLQAANASLDPLREVIMNRLVYRNFGTHETLLGNFVTDIGADIGGVRWFELRRTGGAGNWTLYQEGTYAPTLLDNRWMGGIAMDGSGNIALAYNVSSQTIFPSIRYTGRLASDTLGLMTQPETVLGAGTASNASNRYGDYSQMSIDPSDDCTFWFTGQFNPASTWNTRIGSFKFDQCGAPSPSPTPTATATATPTATATATPAGSISGTVTYGTAPAGPPRPVPAVSLAAAGLIPVNATTNAAGVYSLTGFGLGAYVVTPTKSGTVNGSISGLDAARVAQHVAGLISLTSNQQLAGDATNNGSLSGLDAARIAQFAAGLTNPGIAGDWKFVGGPRNYPSVLNAISNENYEAVLVGDVTGNWSTPVPRPAGNAEPDVDRASRAGFDDPAVWNRRRGEEPVAVEINLPGSAKAGKRSVITLPIVIGDTAGKGVVAYEFTLDYDPGVLAPALEPVTTAGTLSAGWAVTVNTNTPGQMKVIAYNTQQLTGSGNLLKLNFRVLHPGQLAMASLNWRTFIFNETRASYGPAGLSMVSGMFMEDKDDNWPFVSRDWTERSRSRFGGF